MEKANLIKLDAGESREGSDMKIFHIQKFNSSPLSQSLGSNHLVSRVTRLHSIHLGCHRTRIVGGYCLTGLNSGSVVLARREPT